VARLTTARERTELRTSDGRQLAEIDHDFVAGRALLPTTGTPSRSLDVPGSIHDVHFVEVEVELAEGSAQEVLEAVVHRLRLAGARSSARQSKLSTVLGLASPAPPPAADGAPPGEGGDVRRAPPLMSDALAGQARSCLDAVLDHDPAIRLGDPDPEHVHRARVGVRRLRSVMRSLAPLVASPPGELDNQPETWFDDLRDELKWLGGALGDLRDADVRLQGLVQECSTLPPADNLGAAVLLAAAEDDQRVAREALLEAMATDRYLELLCSLEALATEAGTVPAGLWARLAPPASTGLPSLAGRQWRALRRAVRGLGDEPPDVALHQVRIQAKRLRYLAEVAAPFAASPAHRRAAERTAKAATRLQDVLGELHDASVTEQWLRDRSSRLPSRTRAPVVFATGLAAGQLAARGQEHQQALRQKWPAAWAPLQSRQLHHWVEP
jgi:CHAD domain-containing protein